MVIINEVICWQLRCFTNKVIPKQRCQWEKIMGMFFFVAAIPFYIIFDL